MGPLNVSFDLFENFQRAVLWNIFVYPVLYVRLEILRTVIP